MACSSGSKKIEVPEDNNKRGPANPAIPPGGANSPVTTDHETDAEVTATIDKAEFAKYLNFTGNLTFNFEYLGFKAPGSIKIENDKGTMTINGLPSGQSGTITLELLENNVPKLRGTKDGVTLTKGNNPLKFPVQEVTDASGNPLPPIGGATDATLVLDITVGPPDGTGIVPPPASGTFDFQRDIVPIAQASCSGTTCHNNDPLAKDFWVTKKVDATNRLQAPAGSISTMPKGPKGPAMLPADRQKLIDWLKTI